jgi:hypothetical protein
MLFWAAGRALESGKGKEKGYWWDWLTTILYCSLSIEAIGNTYGEMFIPDWDQFESASPLAKIRLVAERCGLERHFGTHPWAIVPNLVRFRNAVAHAKLENITIDTTHPQEEYERYLYAKSESKLEKMVTDRFAQDGYDNIKEILRLFSTGLPRHKLVQIETEGWQVAQNSYQTRPNQLMQQLTPFRTAFTWKLGESTKLAVERRNWPSAR